MSQTLLNRFAYDVTSQGGEDGIVAYLVGHLSGIPKLCCEFGAWDGRHLSNVYSLWHDQGWKAVLIEADEQRCGQIESNVRGRDAHVFNQLISVAGPGSLDALFEREALDPELGVLSIDIDSHDYHVWKSLRVVSSWIVVIEHNPTIPAHIDYFDPEEEVFFLCSAAALERLGLEKGYRLVACTRSNSIFIRSDLWSADWLPDQGVRQLFNPLNHRRWVVDSQLFPDLRGKNRYPGFFAGPRALRWIVKSLRRAQAKFSNRPFVEPSQRIRERAAASGIHCP